MDNEKSRDLFDLSVDTNYVIGILSGVRDTVVYDMSEWNIEIDDPKARALLAKRFNNSLCLIASAVCGAITMLKDIQEDIDRIYTAPAEEQSNEQ